MQVSDSSRFKGQRTVSYLLLGRSTKLCGKVVDVGRERTGGYVKNPLDLFLCRVGIVFFPA